MSSRCPERQGQGVGGRGPGRAWPASLSSRAERAALTIPALALLGVLATRETRVDAAQAAQPSRGAASVAQTRRVPRTLRVCADPNNLPFSNRRGEGFENRLAELVARDLGARVEYTWWAERRGFIRNTLSARRCDVVMGLPAGFGPALTTRPYYRSTYAFVYRAGGGHRVRSLDDPRLRRLRVGIHVIGADYNGLPPAVALARRGIVRNVVGYSIYGDYATESPPSALIDAVARGDVDVAIAWGPLAGYHARRSRVPLALSPVAPAEDSPAARFVYAIALGVRRGDSSLRAELDGVLARRHAEIDRILGAYGVPLVGAGPAPRVTAARGRCPPGAEGTCD